MRAPDMILKISTAFFAVILFFEFFSKVKPDGVVTGAILGVICVTWKLYELFPGGAGELQGRIDLAGKHIGRCAPTTDCPSRQLQLFAELVKAQAS